LLFKHFKYQSRPFFSVDLLVYIVPARRSIWQFWLRGRGQVCRTSFGRESYRLVLLQEVQNASLSKQGNNTNTYTSSFHLICNWTYLERYVLASYVYEPLHVNTIHCIKVALSFPINNFHKT